MLCTACKVFAMIDYRRWHEDEVPVDFERCDFLPSCVLMKTTADLGCQMCELLLHEVQSQLTHISDPTPFSLGSAKYTCESCNRSDLSLTKNGVYCLEITLRCEALPLNKCTQLSFRVYSEDAPDKEIFTEIPYGPPVDFGLLRRRLPADNPTASGCITFMKTWIHECTTNHQKCQLHEDPFFPTRVIDVGNSDDNPIIRLVTGSGLHGDYMALSHCWGNPTVESISKTEENNLEWRYTGFLISSMSKNFRDAVLLTRLLGIQYLWIDSLCIIQDSKADWECESARMDQVYKHSIATLVATRASSCAEGFLQPRYGASRKKVRMPYVWKNYMENSGHYILQSHPRSKAGEYEVDIECSGWNTRGWTLQERFLSRRLIHFSSNKIYLECGTATYAEDNEWIATSPLDRLNVWRNEEDSSYASDSSSVVEPEESACDFDEECTDSSGETEPSLSKYPFDRPSSDLYERWYRLIGAYSSRNLTYESDKLPALSGLAKEMAKATGDRYLAGLWEKDIIQGLLWMSFADDDKLSLQSQYRAPSWSWASLNGQITSSTHWSIDRVTDWSAVHAVPVLHLREAHVELTGIDQCGAVTSARLKISGRIMKVVLSEPVQRMTSGGVRSLFPFCIQIPRSDGMVKIGAGHLDMRDSRLIAEDNIWCLQVERQRPGIAEVEDPWCGLLLMQIEDESSESMAKLNGTQTFRRIGLFVLYEDYLDIFDDCQETDFDLV